MHASDLHLLFFHSILFLTLLCLCTHYLSAVSHILLHVASFIDIEAECLWMLFWSAFSGVPSPGPPFPAPVPAHYGHLWRLSLGCGALSLPVVAHARDFCHFLQGFGVRRARGVDINNSLLLLRTCLRAGLHYSPFVLACDEDHKNNGDAYTFCLPGFFASCSFVVLFCCVCACHRTLSLDLYRILPLLPVAGRAAPGTDSALYPSGITHAPYAFAAAVVHTALFSFV